MFARQHATADPDRIALIRPSTGESVTYASYEQRSNRIAHLFRAMGLRRADHVAFLMENNLRLLEFEGAAERVGLYYTLVNSHLTAGEAAYIIDDCRAQVVVTSNAMAEIASALPSLCPRVRRWLMVDADQPPAPFERAEDAVARFPETPVADEEHGSPMLYSSGTTGRPKGILRPLPDEPPGAITPRIDQARRLFAMRERMVYLSPAPLYHGAPQSSVATALRLGSTCIIMDRFDPARFLELIAEHRVTHSQVVPTMFNRLLRLPDDVRASADLSSLEAVVHAAAPCPIPVKEQMIDWFGPIINEYYSATEANGATACDTREWLAHKGTVGRAIAGEIAILDDERNEVPQGTIGTVWFRGATRFSYFNDDQQTSSCMDRDRNMSTVGDVGYLDDEDYLYLTDRKSLMIISGGVNIYPQEIENVLMTHDAVLDAAVFGVPNEDFGEEVKAVVQLVPEAEGRSDLEQDLLDFCHARLSKLKCPRSVDFEAELPRMPTGKLLKHVLRARYWPASTDRQVTAET